MSAPILLPLGLALLTLLATGGFVGALFYSHIVGRSASNRRFQKIAAQETSFDRRASVDESNRKRAVESTLRELEERRKTRRGGKPSLLQRMRQAGLSWSKKKYCFICAVTGTASFSIAFSSGASGWISSIGFGISGGLLLPHLYVSARRSRRFKAFSDEFPNAVDVIVRGIKAGLPLVDCLRVISSEAQEPVRSEFRMINEDQTMGMPLEQAVHRLVERIPLSETNFFAIVIAVQSRTGGSLSEALGNLSRVLRERKKMQAKIKAMSSEAKASAGIIGALPIVLAGLLYLTAPDYIGLLFTTTIGHVVIAACALWMGIGIIVMRQMISFDF